MRPSVSVLLPLQNILGTNFTVIRIFLFAAGAANPGSSMHDRILHNLQVRTFSGLVIVLLAQGKARKLAKNG